MKQSEILKVLAQVTGQTGLAEINKALKTHHSKTRFRMTGPGFVHSGFTGLVKAITVDGIKIYNVNRVNLVRFDDIKTFAKAEPKETIEKKKSLEPQAAVEKKKSAEPKPVATKTKAIAKSLFEDEEEDFDNDDDFDAYADEDDDVIENENFEVKLVTKKDQKKEEAQSSRPKHKKKGLHKPGSGSLFIPKKG